MAFSSLVRGTGRWGSDGTPTRSRRWPLLLAALLAVPLAAGACGGDGAPSGDGGSDADPRAEAATDASGGGQYTVDMEEIFPPGEGRDLVLNNCQNCHTWVPIVVLQMNEQEWDRWARDHRGRVEALTDEEFAALLAYLKENFNPETPVPDLPPALLETWTSY